MIKNVRFNMKKFLHSKRKRKWKQFAQIGILNFWRLIRRKRNKHVYIDGKVSVYIDSLVSSRVSENLLQMHRETDNMERGEMQIDLSEAEFLKFLVNVAGGAGPKNVLEIGTFRGWSTAVLAEAGSDKVITIELRESEAAKAQEFWKKYLSAENQAKIDLKIGNAKDVLKDIATEIANTREDAGEKFDLIFIDADKNNYVEYLSVAKTVIREGGLIVLDNMLNAGLVATSASDNTTEAIRSLNDQIFESANPADLEFEPYIIPAWDGVVVIRRK